MLERRECWQWSGLRGPAQTAPLEQAGGAKQIGVGVREGEDEDAPPGTTLRAPAQGSWSEGAVGLTVLGDGLGVQAAHRVGGMRAENEGRRGWRAAMHDEEEPPKRRAHEGEGSLHCRLQHCAVACDCRPLALHCRCGGDRRALAVRRLAAARSGLAAAAVSVKGRWCRRIHRAEKVERGEPDGSDCARPWFYSLAPPASRPSTQWRRAICAAGDAQHRAFTLGRENDVDGLPR